MGVIAGDFRDGLPLFLKAKAALSPIERRKSTVRKPSALSAKPANDFENRPVQNPPNQKEMEAHYEWEGCFRKRAPVPHYRFFVSADCSFPS